MKLQAWGVCSSTDQVGRSGAGAKHSREGLDAQSFERAVYPRGSSGVRVAYRVASSAELLGHVHQAKASSLPFQHDRRRAADRATTPTSSSSKYIIDWTSSGYISPLLQRVEGGSLAVGALAATCGREVRQASMTSRMISCTSFPNVTQSMRSVETRAERRLGWWCPILYDRSAARHQNSCSASRQYKNTRNDACASLLTRKTSVPLSGTSSFAALPP